VPIPELNETSIAKELDDATGQPPCSIVDAAARIITGEMFRPISPVVVKSVEGPVRSK
jgi:hypothetical protein